MKGFSECLTGDTTQPQGPEVLSRSCPDARPASRQTTCDVLVLDALLRQSLATIRSLGSRGLRVAALGNAAQLPAFSSRWCCQAFICPAEEGTDEYLHYLEQVLDDTGARILIPSSDATIALLNRYRRRLEQRACLALAGEAALAIAVNKERTLEIAKRLGLDILQTMRLEHIDEMEEALREIGLPAFIKPVESWSWNGEQGERMAGELVTTRDEARRAVERLVRFGGAVLWQQFAPGVHESVSFLYARGQVYARYAQQHVRNLAGQSSLRQSIAIPPDIGTVAERLIREIDLEGCSEVEFRRDAAGTAYLMEINPRLWASVEHAVRSGVDFPYLLYQWASGEPIDIVENYRTGIWLRHLRNDITVLRATFKQRGRPGVVSPLRAIYEFCLAFFIPMKYDYIDVRDPLPAFQAVAGYVREMAQRAPGRSQRRPFHP